MTQPFEKIDDIPRSAPDISRSAPDIPQFTPEDSKTGVWHAKRKLLFRFALRPVGSLDEDGPHAEIVVLVFVRIEVAIGRTCRLGQVAPATPAEAGIVLPMGVANTVSWRRITIVVSVVPDPLPDVSAHVIEPS